MRATRTFRKFGTGGCGVELIAPDTVESRLTTLALEQLMIPAIVPQPQGQEHDRHKRAVDYSSDRKVEHRIEDVS
jgi:hypothetical protein